MEEHIKKLYQILHTAKTKEHLQLRRQSLLVIVHIILNGQLKLKGEIVDILMLLLDEDE